MPWLIWPWSATSGQNATVSADARNTAATGNTATVTATRFPTVQATPALVNASGLTAIFRGTWNGTAAASSGTGSGNAAVLRAAAKVSANAASVTATGGAANIRGGAIVTASIGTATGAGGSANVPTTPTGLTTANISQSATEFTISWNAGTENHTGFKIYRNINGAGFVFLDTAASGDTTYPDNEYNQYSGLHGTIQYKVEAYSTAGALSVNTEELTYATLQCTDSGNTASGNTATLRGNALVSPCVGQDTSADGLHADVTATSGVWNDPYDVVAAMSGSNIEVTWKHDTPLMTFDVERSVDGGAWEVVV